MRGHGSRNIHTRSHLARLIARQQLARARIKRVEPKPKVVGFYRDKEKKVRPITERVPRKQKVVVPRAIPKPILPKKQIPKIAKVAKPKEHKIPLKEKPSPSKMTHIEKMHLLAACKQFGIDIQEVDNTINYYENKKHIQELAHAKGFSEGEITSMEREAKEWANQYESYLSQLKGELESAGYDVREPNL